MIQLHLTATTPAQEKIKAYLQENASETLAEKINNGTPIEKDGKELINKKTLDGFMKYAGEEAKRQAEKGANSTCVEDAVVFGWAIHYFEEESIEEKLFNMDGTQYSPVKKPAAKSVQKSVEPVKIEPIEPLKPQIKQATLWDMMTDHEPAEKAEESVPEEVEQPVPTENEAPMPEFKPYPLFYAQYIELSELYPNSVILLRLGNFYEAFDEYAKSLADELDLTLTSRKITENERVAMVGFPYHASDMYFKKIRENHDIAILESDGNISTLAKITKVIDTQTGEIYDEDDIEEMTEAEMRAFDGDIYETQNVDTAADEENEQDDETDLPYSPSSFDKEAMIYLYELLDGKLDIA